VKVEQHLMIMNDKTWYNQQNSLCSRQKEETDKISQTKHGELVWDHR